MVNCQTISQIIEEMKSRSGFLNKQDSKDFEVLAREKDLQT